MATAETVFAAIRQRMSRGCCPAAGAVGECAALYPLATGGYIAHLYLWNAAAGLRARAVADWFSAAGATDVIVCAVLHDPDNRILEGASVDDGVRPWDVTFQIPAAAP